MAYDVTGKTPQELGQELANHVAKGEYAIFIEHVKILVDAGATLEERDAKGNTPLLSAALHGYPDVAEFLYKRGADINAVSPKGNGILHYTLPHPGMDRGSDEFHPIADMALSDKSFNVNVVNDMKQSGLTIAAKEHLRNYVQQLVDLGADLDQVDWEKKNALQHAQSGSNGEPTVKVLETALAERDVLRKMEAQQRAIEELRQEVSAIVGIVGKGSGQQHSAPATARFKARKIESL
jgi:ankyrin repeat protein